MSKIYNFLIETIKFIVMVSSISVVIVAFITVPMFFLLIVGIFSFIYLIMDIIAYESK